MSCNGRRLCRERIEPERAAPGREISPRQGIALLRRFGGGGLSILRGEGGGAFEVALFTGPDFRFLQGWASLLLHATAVTRGDFRACSRGFLQAAVVPARDADELVLAARALDEPVARLNWETEH